MWYFRLVTWKASIILTTLGWLRPDIRQISSYTWPTHTAHFTLHTSYYTLLITTHFLLRTSLCSLHTAHFTLQTAHWILYSAHRNFSNSHFTLNIALHTAHSTILYTSDCTLYCKKCASLIIVTPTKEAYLIIYCISRFLPQQLCAVIKKMT